MNTDFGFRVSLPTGWSTTEVSSSADALEVIFTPTALADRAQLKVKVNPPGVGREAEAAVKIVLASVKDDANHTNAATERRRIGEHEAAGLVIDNSAMGQTWRVRQAYMGRDGVMFQFQDICWPDEYDRRVEAFDEIWDTVRFTGLGDEQRRRKQLNDLAERCGSEVDWAADWDEAERRARTSGRPILASARVYPGFAISDERMSGFFMDQDVIALLDERFVP
ncbi:MAG: hypothetical protein ACYTFT_15315, partial [Planctomycetota bacterium]